MYTYVCHMPVTCMSHAYVTCTVVMLLHSVHTGPDLPVLTLPSEHVAVFDSSVSITCSVQNDAYEMGATNFTWRDINVRVCVDIVPRCVWVRGGYLGTV